MPGIDLFASRLNLQTQRYVSGFPDPGAFLVDAFSLSWKNFKPYIFPPFSLISRILHKLKLEEVLDAIVIAPLWPTTHWYPQFLELAVQRPVLLPQRDTLLTLPEEDVHHPLKDAMHLVACTCTWSSLEARGISQRAASYVLKSWHPRTEKQYSAA